MLIDLLSLLSKLDLFVLFSLIPVLLCDSRHIRISLISSLGMGFSGIAIVRFDSNRYGLKVSRPIISIFIKASDLIISGHFILLRTLLD